MTDTAVEPTLHRHVIQSPVWPGEPSYGSIPLVDRHLLRNHLDPRSMRGSSEFQLPDIARRHLAMKRAIDVTVASIALVMLFPLMLAIAALVKLTSRGPVLFQQTRVGKGGTHFTILKFRTMRHNTQHAVRSDPELWAEYVANDFKLPADSCQITRIGKLLRKTSLDELPQLINVIYGDMSLVGIRPLLPDELAARPVRSQCLYEVMRPGMTGLWQVEGRSLVQDDARIALDDRYVVAWRPWADATIAMRTPVAVLKPAHAV